MNSSNPRARDIFPIHPWFAFWQWHITMVKKGKYHLSTVMKTWFDLYFLKGSQATPGFHGPCFENPSPPRSDICLPFSLLLLPWLLLGSRRSRPGNKDSRASSLFVRWPQKVLGGDWTCEMKKRRKAVHGAFVSRLPLQTTGAQCCWELLGDGVGRASELSHLRGEGTGAFILQLLSLLAYGYLQRPLLSGASHVPPCARILYLTWKAAMKPKWRMNEWCIRKSTVMVKESFPF